MNERTSALSTALREVAFAERDLADQWVRNSGLTRQQAFALGYVQEHQGAGVNARELAEVTRTTPASVTSLVQGLEERGLLRRLPSPLDSRIKLLQITSEGIELVHGFRETMEESTEQLYSPLNRDEQEQLLDLLRRLVS